PGHGGIDSGAVAADGMMEKKLTLQFAKILQNVLSSNPKIKVLLTRTTDTYLYLSERVQKARELKADLFISIHADIINSPAIRGATIYRLSEIGSDKLAQQLAISQNKVDELGSLTLPETPKVENILLDLTKKETDNFRSAIVSMMVNALKQQHIRLINHPDRSANFYVLKALEFPSILVELGYLSNKSDEYLIRDGKWQMKMAHAMANAIEKFRKYRLANSSNQR
ncbi:MAG: N-acetylmuramoyl-L-alanine amidase, partial [Alphaproteobacteria bacterium]|nr:N-acetylmuramoyl-L-alanine amidase [Alphaproteobacteria bacterium]